MLTHLHRLDKGDRAFQTLGELKVFSPDFTQIGATLCTVEPPWVSNRKNISCIYNGYFDLIKRWSKQFGKHFEVVDVYGRSLILFHIGNFKKDTNGCTLPGYSFTDIDEDGHVDTTSSGDAMDWLNSVLPFRSKLLITSEFQLSNDV